MHPSLPSSSGLCRVPVLTHRQGPIFSYLAPQLLSSLVPNSYCYQCVALILAGNIGMWGMG